MNILYHGDCMEIMESLEPSSVDLIYLDPPFNSDRSYNAIYKDNTGRPLPEQVEAFCDSWEMTPESMALVHQMPMVLRQAGIEEHATEMWKFWTLALGHTQPSLLAYLAYMTARLLRMRVLLKPTGTLYYHCDPTASHYIKIILDIVFGHTNFRNEIIWHYYNKYGAGKKVFARNYDQIFLYTKSDTYTFNPQREVRAQPVRQLVRENIGGVLKNKRDENGNLMYRMAQDKKVDCVWPIPCLQPASKEHLGYPTQKPLALLRRIIAASSKEGDVILDPFCGCATTICAAQELKRRWIGIDIAFHAVRRVARARLTDTYGLVEGTHFSIKGIPRTPESAQDMWEHDTHLFARWAIESVEGFVSAKKSGDGGADGCIYFGAPGAPLSTMIVQVKGGKSLGIGDLRDLYGAMQAMGAHMAGLITRVDIPEKQKKNFHEYMAQAGHLTVDSKLYPRLQILTLSDILAEKRFAVPYPASIETKQPALPYSGSLL